MTMKVVTLLKSDTVEIYGKYSKNYKSDEGKKINLKKK